ncbi:DNA/RNA non-specific endonuclease [Caulobacter segnis]|uniref:DNA/RNA non-specific endonuclease n=1 Tax=Caulobacter segnis TaxID=88688 RepID=UPI00285BDFC5|nr:DNA/RNA non-specific endonuclease [Caulobacter segnis]MDR6625703.1 DNA/RNA endonuclease G (NUC1) [Caulobacter segnis]
MTQKGSLRMLTGALAAGLLLLAGHGAEAADLCSASEKADADRALTLSASDKAKALEEHLPWGAPRPQSTPSASEVQLVQSDYVIQYDSRLRIPIWTADHVVDAAIGQVDRSDCFRPDPRLTKEAAASPTDYDEPIFDQGHLTPSADVTKSRLSVHNSFLMSNMAPQFCQFNRGVWQILEGLTRLWAKEYGEVYVLSGSVFDRNGDGVRDPDDLTVRMTSRNGQKRVAVPSAFYKIIARKRPDGGVEVLAVMMPHDQTDLDGKAAFDYITSHITRLSKISAVTGLAFFPQATSGPDEALSLWPFDPPGPKSLTNSPQCKRTAGALITGTYALPN